MNILDYLDKETDNYDAKQLKKLKESHNTCIVWGNGDLAVNVIELLKENGKTIDYIYVDREYKSVVSESNRNGITENIPVIDDISSALRDGEEADVVLGHARYERSIELSAQNKNIKIQFYKFSNPFKEHDRRISLEYIENNGHRFNTAYESLDDELSKYNFISYINSRINKDTRYIDSYDGNYYNNSVFRVKPDEVFVDIGAYNGDTVRSFIKNCDGLYKYIYAFEPQKKAYEELCKYIKENGIARISPFDVGIYKQNGVIKLYENDTSSYHVEGDLDTGVMKEINVCRLKDVVKKKVDLIKINQQGDVWNTLEGCSDIIKRDKPKLSIVVGLDVEHLLRIPIMIKSIDEKYRVYLRFLGELPSRLTLFAVYNGN